MEEITGMFLYDGKHTTQQVNDIDKYFNELLIYENFDTIIELGTSLAGLTYIIDDILTKNNLKKNIHTFDFSYRDYVENELNKRNCRYYILDEFTLIYEDTVSNLIKNGGKTLVLCDGGNKIDEFNKYSKYLKNGDFIMAHDYAYDEKTFLFDIKDKVWNWFEISYKDINESILSNNLNEYSKINFKNAVWCCYVKI